MGFKIKVSRDNITVFECCPLENDSGNDFYECAEEPCYTTIINLIKWHGVEKLGGMVDRGTIGQEVLEVFFKSGDVFTVTGPFENYGTIRLISELFK
jgi:hypothetical protein